MCARHAVGDAAGVGVGDAVTNGGGKVAGGGTMNREIHILAVEIVRIKRINRRSAAVAAVHRRPVGAGAGPFQRTVVLRTAVDDVGVRTNAEELRDTETVVEVGPAARRTAAGLSGQGVDIGGFVNAAVVAPIDGARCRCVEIARLDNSVIVGMRLNGCAVPPADLDKRQAAIVAAVVVQSTDYH